MEGGKPLTIERTFDAPREVVFEFWSECEEIEKWWGAQGFTCPSCSIDFRVGGKYLYAMQNTEGQIFWVTGTYKEIIPFEKIVSTDSFANENGEIIHASEIGMPGDWPMELLYTVMFEQEGEKTKLTIIHEGIPNDDREDCKIGWTESLDKLEHELHLSI